MTLEKTRLFVLGAGFSAGAGIPMTDSLLSGAMELMKEECPGIYERIEDSAQVCFENDSKLSEQKLDATGFSKLSSFLHYIEMRNFGGGERWSNAGDRELLTFKYFISKKIAHLTPDNLPEIYLEFAKQLDCYDLVMTFNWDCLLEKALLAIGKNYTYNWSEIDWISPEKANTVCIVKMHGSINWTLPHGREVDSRVYQHIGFDPNFGIEPIYFSDLLFKRKSWQTNDWLTQVNNSRYLVQPFIILPGIGKPYDVRKLASFWYCPGATFSTRRNIYIIGMSLSEDDFFVRFMFLESLPLEDWNNMERKTVIINPSEADLAKYSFVPHENREIRQKYFDINDVKYIAEGRK